ncbi:DEAD/DEAH box helicase [Winogradskyella aurantiaca]|uniref:DEAD/DEAH box helicase n=1 Tax=Winogradskyella aurantiaca TaxID=2219558 RepID=UPI000E1D93AC|nr:DEAD/DEAH box helicase [Winogradskyella aurantiaca]
MRFSDLDLKKAIIKALQDQGYTEPTPIQAKAIPYVLKGQDVLGSAQTGTGKTAAFAIPIIQKLLEDGVSRGRRPIRALVVTPTRELAIQIGDNFNAYSRHTSLKSTVIFGGVKQQAQVATLRRGVDILVATPGRLLDLISQGYISLNDVGYFVLDEADRMLDMGFIHDIKKLLTLLPRQRQSLFFSATMPKTILKLSQQILTNPQKVAVNAVSSTAETLQQFVYPTNKKTKKDLLLHLLNNPDLDQALVFSRTKHGADRIVRDLKKKGISCAAIHGGKSQNQRQKALKQFKNKDIRLLIATDIAARGIDINQLRYVINYDIPNEPETYVHRIGRAGRAGEEGIALSLCEPEENAYVKDIEKLIKASIEKVTSHPFPQTDSPMTAQERKDFEKEKQRRKQEFFANRKKNRDSRGSNNNRRRR